MGNNRAGEGGWMVAALAGAVLGPALQLQQAQLWSSAVYASIVAVAGVCWALFAIKSRVPGAFAAKWMAACAIAFAVCGLRAGHFLESALPSALEGRDIVVTGVVAAMPQRSELGQRFRLEVESAQADGSPVQVPPRLLLGWYADAGPDLRPGERWQMAVRLKAPHGNLNPHGFDLELWLWEQGIQATGNVRSGKGDPVPRRLGDSWRHPVERARQSVRESIYARVADRQAAGLLAALVTGDQAAIDRADWDVFRATGVAHLMSISGLHITMFAWVAALAVGWAWQCSARLCLAYPAPHAALLGGMAFAAAYALFSGWGVPAQRTVWMLACIGLLRLSGRQWPWPLVWLLACAVVVTVDPWALMQAGFWLSFVAVGVLFATDSGATEDRPTPAGARFGLMFREQWVVTLALTPLSLLLFGQVSLVGLFANLLAIPWVTLLVTPLAMAGVLLPAAWDGAAWAVQGMAWVLEAMAAWPFATVSMPAAPVWAGACGVLGGVLLAMRLPWAVRLLAVPLLVPVVFWQVPRPPPGAFELLAADIGQGNAVLVRTAGHTLVYDAGPRYSAESDAGHRVLVPLLRAYDETVDMLVVSHRDSDHSGGAAAVLRMQPGAAFVSSVEPGHELLALRAGTRCLAGQHWEWDRVHFEFLHPEPTDYEAGGKPNARSCVLRISGAGGTALLAGDIELAQETKLVAQGAALQADVLLVPHHGSKTSSSEVFIDAVRPRWAIVQAGYRNRFGHPAPPVVARYDARAIRMVDSPACGAAHWSSETPGDLHCQRKTARRYWHHRQNLP